MSPLSFLFFLLLAAPLLLPAQSLQNLKGAPELKTWAALHSPAQLPFVPEQQETTEPIPDIAWPTTFADTSEMQFFNALHPGQIFFQPKYFGLVTFHEYSPGAMGIYNTFLRLTTLTYSGTVISQIELGCAPCFDSNMGANDYYETNDACTIDTDRITCKRTEHHGTFIEEELPEGQAPIDETSHDSFEFRISPTGEVTPQ